MSEIPRRTLEDLITRYTLEPGLCDVFVEGRSDRQIVDWFSRALGVRNPTVFEIDGVEIGAGLLASEGLPDNTRSRVILLSKCLASQFMPDVCKVTCIADRDFDDFHGTPIQNHFLLYTDFSSMEMYFYCSPRFRQNLIVHVGLQHDVESLFSGLNDVLVRLFVFRCTNIKLGWGMTWFEPYKCLRLNNCSPIFDESEFVVRYLNKNSRASSADEFRVAMVATGEQAVSMPLLAIRGHDAFQLLAWILRELGVTKDICCEVVLSLVARASSAVEELLEFPMFQQLRTRLS
jgi:hypothetical protein